MTCDYLHLTEDETIQGRGKQFTSQLVGDLEKLLEEGKLELSIDPMFMTTPPNRIYVRDGKLVIEI